MYLHEKNKRKKERKNNAIKHGTCKMHPSHKFNNNQKFKGMHAVKLYPDDRPRASLPKSNLTTGMRRAGTVDYFFGGVDAVKGGGG